MLFSLFDGAELTVGGAQRMADDFCERIAVSFGRGKSAVRLVAVYNPLYTYVMRMKPSGRLSDMRRT